MNKEEFELYMHTLKLKKAIMEDMSTTENGDKVINAIGAILCIGIDLGRYCEAKGLPNPLSIDEMIALMLKVGIDKSEKAGGTEWLDKIQELFNDFL